MSDPKPPVTRGALERVLARAAELQAASGDDTTPQDALSEAQVLELGKEVGLSPEHIRQALAEERARIDPVEGETAITAEGGIFGRLFGAGRIAAQRVVRGSPQRVLATLDRWMQREEWLRVMRQREDRIVWEPRGGLIAGLKRAFGDRAYALHRANHISATVVSVDQSFSLARLEADFTVHRRTMATQTLGSAAFGSAATGAMVLMGFMIPIAVVPAVGVVSASYAASRRAHRSAIQRALLTLEQVLDRLERGDAEAPALLRMIEAALPPGAR
jgi:hypothetical protein